MQRKIFFNQLSKRHFLFFELWLNNYLISSIFYVVFCPQFMTSRTTEHLTNNYAKGGNKRCLIGISSYLKSYRLLYFLEKNMNLEFKEIENSKSEKIENNNNLDIFSCENESANLFLVKNFNGFKYFIPKFKQADYLLMVYYFEHGNFLSSLKQKLSSEKAITTVFEIDLKLLTLKQQKHFD